jgi:1-deoxy-D-xylulose-5-phosphate reductoisomerase
VLTASGGAFRDRPVHSLADVTPEDALKHPTWTMGKKITIDSATLMNKGLEVIEAHWLFDIGFDHIDVVIHHQSVIHSLVEFVDGSVKAQLGLPDMRLPIQYAMAHPSRLSTPVPRLDLSSIGSLTFTAVDTAKYPCLGLAYAAGRNGGTCPTVLNAANEIAVARFLEHDLPFMAIPQLIESALEAHSVRAAPSLDEVIEADQWARQFAETWAPRSL